MGSTNKGFSLLFVVVLGVSSLMIVESAFAQSIPTPSIPEFPATIALTFLAVTTLAVAVVSSRKHLIWS